MKKIILGLLCIFVLGALFYLFNNYIYQTKQGDGLPEDFKEVTFRISGEPVTLQNGVALLPDDLNSASNSEVRYFENELDHDIDGDGDLDTVFLVTEDGGGSGTFFYLVGAINTPEGYIGSQAVFIGDRIAPQTTEAGPETQVVVNFLDRAAGEPMSTQPSVGKSLYLKFSLETMDFGEVAQDFEGESNELANLIVVNSPVFGETVGSPIVVTGEARGYWYFEASFPIEIVDSTGQIIGNGYATANEDWMTEDFVSFSASVEYAPLPGLAGTQGKIILRKDNPSGLPENDASVEVPVLFE